MSKCKIFRDFDTDRITNVLNEQGQDSSLYREALGSIQDEEQALNIWATSLLPSFKEFTQDVLPETQEPSLAQVLKFINNSNTNESLSKQDVTELVNNLHTLNVESPDILLTKLQQTFFDRDGVFRVSRNKLRSSGLYSEVEINDILTFPSIRGGIREFVNKLRNSLQVPNNLSNLFIDNSSVKDFEVQDTSTVLGIGKFQNYLPEEVRDYVLKNTKGFTSETDLLTKIQALDNPDIRNYILNNPDVIDQVKDMSTNSKVVPMFIEMEGNIVPKMSNDLVPTLMNTIRVGESTEAFTDTVEAIKSVSEDQWYQSDLIEPYLKTIEFEAANYQIDVVGLADSYTSKSREEVLSVLEAVDNFLFDAETGGITNVDIYDLGETLNAYFGNEMVQDEKVIPVTESDKSRNLSLIDTSLSEMEVFQTNGFIKVRDNLYQKAVVYESVEAMIEDTYNSLLNDISILPDSVLERLNLKTNGNYNFPYLLNTNNKSNISRKILELVSRDADTQLGLSINTNEDFNWAKQITLYKHLLNIPNQSTPKVDFPSFSARKSFVQIEEQMEDYLTSDFISDFYTSYLQEKALDSPLFNSALKYFEVNDKGITFLSTNPLVKNQVKDILNDVVLTPYLQRYSAISKDTTLEFLIPETVGETLLDIQDRRDYTMNNPTILEIFNGSFEKYDPNTAVLKNTKDEFLRLKDGIYELTDSDRGISVYSKLPQISDPNYFVFNVAKPILQNDVSANMFETVGQELETTNKSGVSKSEVKTLEEARTCQ